MVSGKIFDALQEKALSSKHSPTFADVTFPCDGTFAAHLYCSHDLLLPYQLPCDKHRTTPSCFGISCTRCSTPIASRSWQFLQKSFLISILPTWPSHFNRCSIIISGMLQGMLNSPFSETHTHTHTRTHTRTHMNTWPYICIKIRAKTAMPSFALCEHKQLTYRAQFWAGITAPAVSSIATYSHAENVFWRVVLMYHVCVHEACRLIGQQIDMAWHSPAKTGHRKVSIPSWSHPKLIP